jgi:putative heme-binding domain-containing protein
LLESIAYPSSTLARGFESYTVATDSGQSYTGIIVRETASMVYLRTARDAELRIPRRSIESIQPSAISIMPSGLDKLMTVEQLRDLVAYLTSLKS